MSKFSDLLSALMRERGLTPYILSQKSALERTYLYRIAKGTRLPADPAVVETLCAAMTLTPEEAEALRTSYRITVIGEDIYHRRQAVEEMLLSIGDLGKSPLLSQPESSVPPISLPSTAEGERQVQTVLKQVIDQEPEDGFVFLFLQPKDSFLQELLRITSTIKPGLDVQQVIYLDNGPNAEENNILSFRSLLPNLFSSQSYQCWYYYAYAPAAQNRMMPFPELLVTSRWALQLAGDSSQALIYPSESDIWKIFYSRFRHCQEDCRPLVHRLNGLDEQMDFYTALHFSSEKMSARTNYSILPDLCVTSHLTAELIEQLVIAELPHRQAVTEAIKAYIHQLQAHQKCFHNVEHITRTGVLRFLETGWTEEIPRQFYRPIPPQLRRRFLDAWIQDGRRGEIELHLYDQAQLPFCDKLNLFVDRKEPAASLVCGAQTGCLALGIQEPTIVPALWDYLESLSDHPAVQSHVETIAWLEHTRDAMDESSL